jgi:hypothetical protein
MKLDRPEHHIVLGVDIYSGWNPKPLLKQLADQRDPRTASHHDYGFNTTGLCASRRHPLRRGECVL